MASALSLAAGALASCSLAILAVGSARACIEAPQRLIVPSSADRRSDFCIRQATLHRAAWMRELANGSCHLFDVCAAGSSDRALPLYRSTPPGSRSLLLRCRADRNVDPYSLLIDGSTNTTVATDRDVSGNTDAYKSPMIGLQPSAFSHIQLVLMNASGGLDVNLTFKMSATGRLRDEGAWFSKRNLESAHPWDVNLMKNYANYPFFSMVGSEQYKVRFYIKTNKKSCNTLGSYLRIFPTGKSCNFGGSPHAMSYLWTKGNLSPEQMVMATYGQAALEFRLYGTLADSYASTSI